MNEEGNTIIHFPLVTINLRPDNSRAVGTSRNSGRLGIVQRKERDKEDGHTEKKSRATC